MRNAYPTRVTHEGFSCHSFTSPLYWNVTSLDYLFWSWYPSSSCSSHYSVRLHYTTVTVKTREEGSLSIEDRATFFLILTFRKKFHGSVWGAFTVPVVLVPLRFFDSVGSPPIPLHCYLALYQRVYPRTLSSSRNPFSIPATLFRTWILLLIHSYCT